MQTALVLGAGIMGLCAAWALSRAGLAVRVVDQDAVPNARGSSVDDHRLIRHPYGAQAGYMRMVDPALAAWDLLFAEAGERPYRRTGLLALAGQPGGWLEDSRAALAADGRAHHVLTAGEIGAAFPFLDAAGIAQAFSMEQGGVLLARPIVAMLARHLAARGARPDARPRHRPRPRSRHAGAGRRHDALGRPPHPRRRSLEHAAGARSGGAGAADTPGRGAACPAARPGRGLGARADAARPRRDPRLLRRAAGRGHAAQDQRPPLRRHRRPRRPARGDGAGAEAILALARHRIRDLHRYRVLSAAACWYDVEPDERFILEKTGGRAFVMSGFSGHGFKFGAVLGLALARAARDGALVGALAAWAAGLAPPAPGLLDDVTEGTTA